MEGQYVKTCNCDPGCPCDFNARPTYGDCTALNAMRIERGRFGDTDLAGCVWGLIASWPGPLHEGNGSIQLFLDSAASERQREGLIAIASGRHGGALFEILVMVCPDVKEPIVAPVEFRCDLDTREAGFRVGELAEVEVETLRAVGTNEPYRVIVRIPGGFEYTGENDDAETALATRAVSRGAIAFAVENGHANVAYVRHSSERSLAA